MKNYQDCSTQGKRRSDLGTPFWIGKRKDQPTPAMVSEQVSEPIELGADPVGNRYMTLKRGQYRIQGRINVKQVPDPEKMLMRNVEVPLLIDNEYKRVAFHKIDIQPPKEVDGEMMASYTMVFTVVDNPIPLAPIIWGAASTISLVSGYFFVDKVESFTKTGTGSLVLIGLSAAALLLAWPK